MLNYRLTLQPDSNGTILVTSPDFPLVTFGDDPASAIEHAKDAAHTLLQSMMDDREEIPSAPVRRPDAISLDLPLQTRLKVALYVAMRSGNKTRADLQRLLGWQRESIDRLFRLDHNSKIEQLGEAFTALGKDVDLILRDLPLAA